MKMLDEQTATGIISIPNTVHSAFLIQYLYLWRKLNYINYVTFFRTDFLQWKGFSFHCFKMKVQSIQITLQRLAFLFYI